MRGASVLEYPVLECFICWYRSFLCIKYRSGSGLHLLNKDINSLLFIFEIGFIAIQHILIQSNWILKIKLQFLFWKMTLKWFRNKTNALRFRYVILMIVVCVYRTKNKTQIFLWIGLNWKTLKKYFQLITYVDKSIYKKHVQAEYIKFNCFVREVIILFSFAEDNCQHGWKC